MPQSFGAWVVTAHDGRLSKKCTYQNNELHIDGSTKLTRGVAWRVPLGDLSGLPTVLKQLTSNDALILGSPVTTEGVQQFFHPSTGSEIRGLEIQSGGWLKRKDPNYAERGYYRDDTGTYLQRGHASFKFHAGPALLGFDFDDKDHPELVADSPEKAVQFLEQLGFRGLSQSDYVYAYSTSSGIHAPDGTRLTGNRSLHLYIMVKDGAQLEAMRDELRARVLANAIKNDIAFPFVTGGDTPSVQVRCPVDTAVFQAERLFYDGRPVMCDGLTSRRPEPEYVRGEHRAYDMRQFQGVTVKAAETRVRDEARNYRSRPEVAAVLDRAKARHIAHLTTRGFSPLQAKVIAESVKDRNVIPPGQVLHFDDGSQLTIEELYVRASEFDGKTLADPLDPENGGGKAMFYANSFTDNAPRINSFAHGGGSYNLLDTFAVSGRAKQVGAVNPLGDKVATVIDEGRYLSSPMPDTRVTLLKAPKGSGKTQWMQELVKTGQLGRVLVITPRISLTENAAERFDALCYSAKEAKDQVNVVSAERVTTTYDSLWRMVQSFNADTIIVDEVEQLVNHTISSTVKHKTHSLSLLIHQLRKAKRVMLADADMTEETVDLLIELKAIRDHAECTAVVNTWQPEERAEVEEVNNRRLFNQRIIEAVATGEGVYVASTSKNEVLKFAKLAVKGMGGDPAGVTPRDWMVELPNGRRVIYISSHNSGDPEVQAFLAKPNENLRADDVFICSPSISTGFSIDAVMGQPLFSQRFLFASKNCGPTPNDVLQHLERVREGRKGSTVMFISDHEGQQSTDPAYLVRQGLVARWNEHRGKSFDRADLRIDPETGQVKFIDETYARVYGYVQARQNELLNSFGANIRAKLLAEGYDVVDSTGAVTKAEEKAQKAIEDSVRIEAVQDKRETPLINELERDALMAKKRLSYDDRLALDKRRMLDDFGFDKDVELGHLEDLFTSGKAEQLRRRRALYIAASNEDLILYDVNQEVRDSDMLRREQTALYEYKKFAELFMGQLGVQLDAEGYPHIDHEVYYTPDEVERLYNWLCAYDHAKDEQGGIYSRLKALTGVSMRHDQEDQAGRGRYVSYMVTAVGLKMRATTVRTRGENGKTNGHLNVKKLDQDLMAVMRRDMQRAREHSCLPWFNTEPSSQLKQLKMYLPMADADRIKLMTAELGVVYDFVMGLETEHRNIVLRAVTA